MRIYNRDNLGTNAFQDVFELDTLCSEMIVLVVKVLKNGQQKTTCNLSCNIAAKRVE